MRAALIFSILCCLCWAAMALRAQSALDSVTALRAIARDHPALLGLPAMSGHRNRGGGGRNSTRPANATTTAATP